MKLYLLTNKIGDFYVVSSSPTHAEEKLKALLDKAEYGFDSERKVTNIKLLAELLGEFPEGKPHFSSGNNLIM